MKKNSFLLTLLVPLAVAVAIPATKTVQTFADNGNTYSEHWISNYTATASDVENGVQISNLKSWGCRSGTTNKFQLDGLKFDFVYTNVTANATAGFYFGQAEDYYSPQTGIADDTITFSLNTAMFGSGQCRFAAFPTHDTNTSHEGVVRQTYTDMSLAEPNGFGYSDGTAVMNAKTDYTLHFEFNKVDDTWYKMSMKATSTVAGGIFWDIESQKPVNDTLTVYFKASKIKMDDAKAGVVKLFVFGFNGDSNPIINIVNYVDDFQTVISFCNTNLFKDTVPTTEHGDTGACVDAYGAAETAYNKLTDTQKTMFKTDSRFKDMRARVTAWATHKGVTPFIDTETSSSQTGVSNSSQLDLAVVLSISAIVAATSFMFIIVYRRKRKAQ